MSFFHRIQHFESFEIHRPTLSILEDGVKFRDHSIHRSS